MKKNMIKISILSLVLSLGFSLQVGATPSTSLSGTSTTGISITTFGSTSNGENVYNVISGNFDCDANSTDDIIMASPTYNNYDGAVFIHSGSTSGLSSANVSSADFIIEGVSENMGFGSGIVKLEDLDNDGCPELGVLASLSSNPETVYIFYSSVISGWTQPNHDQTEASASMSRSSDDRYDTLNNVGAINGSSNGEYLALCMSSHFRECDFFPVSAITGGSGNIEDHVLFTISGNGLYSAMTHGDLDGDGEQDLIMGSHDNDNGGNVVILYGPISNTMGSRSNDTIQPNDDGEYEYSTATAVTGNDLKISAILNSDQNFGSNVGVIDVNNDGKDELIIGNSGYAGSDDTYFIISDIDTMIGSNVDVIYETDFTTYGINYITIEGDPNNSNIAYTHNAVVGNFNGDEYEDLSLGGSGTTSETTDGSRPDNGVSYIFFGGALETDLTNNLVHGNWGLSSEYFEPQAQIDGAGSNDNFATYNAVGDVDGDGLDELIVLAPDAYNYNNDEYSAVYVIDFPEDADSDGDNQTIADGDCNDMDSSVLSQTWYYDSDLDGYGNSSFPYVSCTQPTSARGTYVTNDSDCNDSDSNINPDTVWYQDNDGDGYGDSGSTTTQCEQPTGYVSNNEDCNDSSAVMTPGATWFQDADGDGYGNIQVSIESCLQPDGYVINSNDTNDNDASVFPSGDNEICNDGLDNDGDGLVDAADVDDCNTLDRDDDGFSSLDGDCNDGNVTIYPGAHEIGDAIDNDCDGLIDESLVSIDVTNQMPSSIRTGESFEVQTNINNLSGMNNLRIQVLLPDTPIGRPNSNNSTSKGMNSSSNRFLGRNNNMNSYFCDTDLTNCKVVGSADMYMPTNQSENFTVSSIIPEGLQSGEYILRVRVIDVETGSIVGTFKNSLFHNSELLTVTVR